MKPKFYFSVVLREHAGLSDRISLWFTYYCLGLSMNWTYIHSSLRSERSDLNHNIFDFLGFNDVLSERFPFDQELLHPIIIRVSLERLERTIKNAQSFKDVQNITMNEVRRQLRWKRLRLNFSSTVLVQLTDLSPALGEFKRRLKNKIERSGIPMLFMFDEQSQSPFWHEYIFPSNVYDEAYNVVSPLFQRGYEIARTIHPWPSKFEDEKVKILIHIRQGDSGVLRISSGKLTSGDLEQIEKYWGENSADPQRPPRYIETKEYLTVLQQLRKYFAPDDLSIVTSSDGYKRLFKKIYKRHKQNPFLSDNQLEELRYIEDGYDEREFKPFSDISNTVIGESTNNLRHLIAALMEADIVISGTAGLLTSILIKYYRDLKKPPPLQVLLCPGSTYSRVLSKQREFRTGQLLLNVENPDFDSLKMRIREHIKLVHNSHSVTS